MSEQPGPVAFVSLRSTTATGPYNGEKTLNLNCPAKADHLKSVDFRIVKSLREDGGYEVEAIIEINPSISDEEVLKLANELETVLITEDKDFGELTYRLQKPNVGIILIRMSGIKMAERKAKILGVFEKHLEEFKNSFTVITENRVRIRKID